MKKLVIEFSNVRLITPSGLSLVGQLLGKSNFIKKCNNMKVDGKRSQSQIKNGDTDIGKINYNGNDILNTYTGTATFTPNIEDSQVQVGRGWQYNNQNRTIYGSVKSVRIYNKVLTDEEIKHNYELDKARFKIE